MKIAFYISVLAALFSACSSSQSLTRAQEDDLYYVPGQRSLFAEEVKKKTGVDIDLNNSSSSQKNSTSNERTYSGETDNSMNPKSHAIGMARYATEKQVNATEEKTGQPVARVQIAEGDGYWIGGFKGSDNDLEECVRIMNRYPEGFAYFGNGYEIAQNLSFSPDWNVYTVDNRYWWFPSSSNINLYSQLIFGNYPKYIWTTIWNDPRFDSFAWSNRVSFGFGTGPFYGNSYWGNSWGWNGTMGWGNSWGYDPFWNNGWGYNPWGWNSWYDYGYYPGWGHNHGWGHRPGWGNHRPGWDHGPNWGGANKPSYTTRYAPKKQYTTNRNARSYSTYTRSYRSSNTNRGNNNSSYNPSHKSDNSSGSYSKGSSTGSYGRSSGTTSRSGGGGSGSGSTERKSTGSRR